MGFIRSEKIESICKSVAKGKSVNRNFPDGGKIVIDQILPYLCVYRFLHLPDPYIQALVKTQGAFLVAKADMDLRELLDRLSETITAKFGAFLVLELWSGSETSETFKIRGPETRSPAILKVLSEGLKKLQEIYPAIEVEVLNTEKRHPEELSPLADIEHSKELGDLIIGVEVPPVWKADSDTYHFLFRKIRHKLSHVLKETAFEFIRTQTANPFAHYLTLGKTQLTNRLRMIDRNMTEISDKMNFLLRLTPVNTYLEWEKFRQSGFSRKPVFTYRLISIDVELEKRKLFNLKLEDIEDPTLAFIYRDKRSELEKQLSLLEERGTDIFRHISESLYGGEDEEVQEKAEKILNNSPGEDADRKSPVFCEEFANLAQKEVDRYRHHFVDIDIGVLVRKDVSGILVSKGYLWISEQFSTDTKRANALIQHEVGTHILTYCNGRKQTLGIMYSGLAGYDQLQEGLAVLAEYLVGGLTKNRLRILAGRVMAVQSLRQGADFNETFEMLGKKYLFKPETAFQVAMRVHRGGGFTKDAVYLKGLIRLLAHLKGGGDIRTLYAGKFDLKHVEYIEELIHRRIVKPAFLPFHFEQDGVKEKIKRLSMGIEIEQLSE